MPDDLKKPSGDRYVIMMTFALAGIVAALYATWTYPAIQKLYHTVAAKTVGKKVDDFLRNLDT